MNTDIADRSRIDLIQWVNEIAKTQLTKVEQMGTGSVYCTIFEYLYPGKIPVQKVNYKAKNDYEFVNNFKILQLCFTRLNIQKPIEIEKLVKCKYQDNLEFLQWVKKYFDENLPRRLPPKSRTEPMMSKNSSSSNLSFERVDQKLDPKIELQTQVDTLKCENEYYLSKLRDIDRLLEQEMSKDELVSRIKSVLFETPDKSIAINEDGSLDIQQI